MSQYDLPPDDNDEDYLIDPGEPEMSSVEMTRPSVTMGGVMGRVVGYGSILLIAIALFLPALNGPRDGGGTTTSDHQEWQARQTEIDLAMEATANDPVATTSEQVDE